MLIRGLLAFNLGENLDDLQIMPTPGDDFSTSSMIDGDDVASAWTCNFIDIQLQDVILDVMPDRSSGPVLARINFFKSRLILESFSDSSRDIDLVSQEILLSDLRFAAFPVNKRSNVFEKILQPMANRTEKANWLQAEVHFRATPETNRFTILLNNMRVMGIFDWWIAVLDFIGKNPVNPNPKGLDEILDDEMRSVPREMNKIYVQVSGN